MNDVRGDNSIGVCMYAPTATGGHARYAWEVMTALAQQDEHAGRYRFELVTSADPDGQFWSERYTVHAMLAPLRHRTSYANVLTWAASRVTHYARRELAFLRWLRARPDIDLVHLQEWTWWLSVPFVRRIQAQGKRVVMTVHNLLPHKYPPGVPRAVVHRGIRGGWRVCDALIVHTDGMAAALARLLGESHPPIHVAPHGVWTVQAPAAADGAPPPLEQRLAMKRLLFFGGIRRNKGLEVLLQAVGQLKDYTITVAGEPLDLRYYETEILPLVREVVAQGAKVDVRAQFIPDDEVGALFARHSAIVLPYTSAFVAQSGIVFMALAHELPVVASEAGGLTELMREFEIGVTFRPSTPAALAEAVRRLHEPHRAASLAQRIRAAREQYSWNANAATTLRGYRNVLEPYADLNDCVAETTRAC